MRKSAVELPGTMTPKHPRWAEFRNRLEGPEGCNFRRVPEGSKDPNDTTWECDSNDRTLPKARRILHNMSLSETEIINSILFFHQHGGHCDCEVVFNVFP